MMTGSGCSPLNAWSRVAWLMPLASASVRTSASHSSKLMVGGVGSGVGVTVVVGGGVWVGGGGGGPCRAAGAAAHTHAISAPVMTNRMLKSILNLPGGNGNPIVYRPVQLPGVRATGWGNTALEPTTLVLPDTPPRRPALLSIALVPYSSSSFTSPRSAFDAATIFPCRWLGTSS